MTTEPHWPPPGPREHAAIQAGVSDLCLTLAHWLDGDDTEPSHARLLATIRHSAQTDPDAAMWLCEHGVELTAQDAADASEVA